MSPPVVVSSYSMVLLPSSLSPQNGARFDDDPNGEKGVVRRLLL
jgi:hypothetical protein